jgi:hypothetical protein
MNDDGLSIFDVGRGILASRIVKRQTDLVTGEWKYVIEGERVVSDPVIVVAKLSATDKLVIITVYLL